MALVCGGSWLLVGLVAFAGADLEGKDVPTFKSLLHMQSQPAGGLWSRDLLQWLEAWSAGPGGHPCCAVWLDLSSVIANQEARAALLCSLDTLYGAGVSLSLYCQDALLLVADTLSGRSSEQSAAGSSSPSHSVTPPQPVCVSRVHPDAMGPGAVVEPECGTWDALGAIVIKVTLLATCQLVAVCVCVHRIVPLFWLLGFGVLQCVSCCAPFGLIRHAWRGSQPSSTGALTL